MLSQTLNRVSRSHGARRLVEGLPVTRRVAERFVVGEETSEAVQATASLQASGRLITLDVLGEDVIDLQGARGTTAACWPAERTIISQDRGAIARARRELRFAAGNSYINDKPGAAIDLLCWTSPRSIEEAFVPPKEFRYPHMRAN